jgi:hypothetical protein
VGSLSQQEASQEKIMQLIIQSGREWDEHESRR